MHPAEKLETEKTVSRWLMVAADAAAARRTVAVNFILMDFEEMRKD